MQGAKLYGQVFADTLPVGRTVHPSSRQRAAAHRPLDRWRRANLCQRKQTNAARRQPLKKAPSWLPWSGSSVASKSSTISARQSKTAINTAVREFLPLRSEKNLFRDWVSHPGTRRNSSHVNQVVQCKWTNHNVWVSRRYCVGINVIGNLVPLINKIAV